MKNYFIKELDNNYKKSIKQRIFNTIDQIGDDERKIYVLPICINERISRFKINKISKKLIKKFLEDDIQNVVLSDYLNNINDLKLRLYGENINVLDGVYLFKLLSFETVEYILKIQNIKVQNCEVTFLVNDLNNINYNIIFEFAKSVKRINIVSNHINKFKKIQEYLYNEIGLIINISNNKKTSLLKSKIIINLDFPEELINEYKIYYKAVIINLLEKTNIHSKKFNGVNVNNFEIEIPEKYKINGFKNEMIYEGIIYKNYNFEWIKNKFKEDKVKIKNLIGNKGKISNNEIKNCF